MNNTCAKVNGSSPLWCYCTCSRKLLFTNSRILKVLINLTNEKQNTKKTP